MAIIDFHAHLFTGEKPWLLEPLKSRRSPDAILSAIERAGLDGIGYVDFGSEDPRYEKLVRQTSSNYAVIKRMTNARVYENRKTGKPIYVIRVQEIRSSDKENDFLIIGESEYADSGHLLSMEEIKGNIKDDGLLAVICKSNLGQVTGNKGHIPNAGKYFSAFEAWNGNSKPITEEEIKRIEAEYEMFGFIGSDSHDMAPLNIGSAALAIDIDFTNADSLRESIKHNLTTGNFKRIMKKRPSYQHIIQAGIHAFHLVPIGLMKGSLD